MNAVFFRASFLLAATLPLSAGISTQSHAMGPTSRTQHFIVTARSQQFAQQVCQAAERYRRDLAMEWLGKELPPWRDACHIHVTAGNMGAGGATSFEFIGNEPCRWRMNIQGTPERILDSVLPHEVLHMILATHMGQPLPRWADEGAATSVEHVSERQKQQKLLINFLRNSRGIPFNHMFAMKEYPRDILPLYSQGYSLARYLIAQGGKRKYVDYVADGIQWNNWTAATKKHYGFPSLSELQVSWNDWVRHGSPEPVPTALASHTPPASAPAPAASPQRSVAAASSLVPLPPRNTVALAGHTRPVSSSGTSARPVAGSSSGWYQRQRDLAGQSSNDQGGSARNNNSSLPTRQHLGRPQPPQRPQQIILPPSPTNPPLSGATFRH